MASERPRRIPLGRTGRRLSFERRVWMWMAGLAMPALVFGVSLLFQLSVPLSIVLISVTIFGLAWLIAATAFAEQIFRPMQTLANVVSALREDDFSFRARGARRGDALGDLALEINALAGTLQAQRSSALEALTLVERVMSSMQSPVLAFDGQDRLRLHNAAADRAFGLARNDGDGRTAAELHLQELLSVTDEGTYCAAANPGAGQSETRYFVRRTGFRLRGVPHTLLVLSDVGAALREEERQAWQRLIRVLGHEINNSLTPIKSIAGSLRARLPESSAIDTSDVNRDLRRGLAVIEDRAASLNRFLQAYQQLSSLPAPQLQRVSLRGVLERVAQLEQRLAVEIATGPEVMLLADPDQLQQAFINLVQNGVDAALQAEANGERHGERAAVAISWRMERMAGGDDRTSGARSAWSAVVSIMDNGLGLSNPVNLFVPFYTTKPNGTGIGLALSQQIVVLHKGSLRVENRSGQSGCMAEVRLPVAGDASR